MAARIGWVSHMKLPRTKFAWGGDIDNNGIGGS